MDFCERSEPLSAGQLDTQLRFAAVVREELATSEADAVLISRSGLDLSRFQIRYSHSAVATRGENGIWNARQLYYACDERRPRLYDQGIAGFAMGIEDASLGYISIVTLPADAAQALKETTMDSPRALRLLAAQYSATAYAFGLNYQNCNQWIVELFATAWGDLPDGTDLRKRAQQWLSEQGYAPQPVEIGSHWLLAASPFVPLVHLGDHPERDLAAMKLKISLPTTLEAFIQQRYPLSKRVEICHNGQQVVIHRGWSPVNNGCKPGPQDQVTPLLF